ncbi:hypothetical protein QFC21_005468 [Naganishia friedmannii]|uniref:Uncharacterized protein n=1 Tax=Naganishia friedmannii TaxID=89922 RepID=A0ACC2VAK0_9TREE|nr:hypothetical protein QFC21_005468 [Naganishia friedmannii]
MDTPSSASASRHYGDGKRRDSDSFEMPKMDMNDHDTSELIGNLSLDGGPAFNGAYDDSDLMGDDSYDVERYKADEEGGRHHLAETSGYDDHDHDRSEGDVTVMRAEVAPQADTSPSKTRLQHSKAANNDSSAENQRDERLRAALFELKKMNEVFENYASALEATRHHNERLAARTAQTSQLLDQYVSLLSQTEHTQRLILDKRWTGLNDDVQLAEEEERSRLEGEERRRREIEAASRRAAEQQAERERAQEAKERAAAAAANAPTTGMRSGTSRLGIGRGTRGSAVSGIRGSTRGARGKRRRPFCTTQTRTKDCLANSYSRKHLKQNHKHINTESERWRSAVVTAEAVYIVYKRQEQRIRASSDKAVRARANGLRGYM